jgi:serine/threonine protein kinase
MSDRAAVQRLIDGRYRLIESYPPGHTGIAWQATDTESLVDVVIKLPKLEGDPATRRQNKRELEFEIQALQLLQNTCVPPVIELLHVGSFRYLGNEEYPYFVTRQAKGDNLYTLLSNWMREGQRIPTTEMLEIFEILLETLEKAHNMDLVYNDVDVKHVFWDSSISDQFDYSRRRMEIIDWGNARRSSDPDTPPGISFKEDVYQCGSFLRKVFTGLNTFELGDIDSTIADLIVKIESRSFSTMGELREVVNQILKQRFAQLDSLINQLSEEHQTNSLRFRKLINDSKDAPSQTSIEAYEQSINNTLDKLDQLKVAKHRCYDKFIKTTDNILRQCTYDFIIAFATFDENPNEKLLVYTAQYADRVSALNKNQQTRLKGFVQYVRQTAMQLPYFVAVTRRAWFMTHVANSWQQLAGSFSQQSELGKRIDQTVQDFLKPYSDIGDFEAWAEQALLAQLLITHLNKPLVLFDILLLNDLSSNETLEQPIREFIANLNEWSSGDEQNRTPLSQEYKKLSGSLSQQGKLLNTRIVTALEQYESLYEPTETAWTLDYWHRPITDKYTSRLSEVREMYQKLKEGVNGVRTLKNSADLEQWIKTDKDFLKKWRAEVGITSLITEQKTYLADTEKFLDELRQAVDLGDTGTAYLTLDSLQQTLLKIISAVEDLPSPLQNIADALRDAEANRDPRKVPFILLADSRYEKTWQARQEFCDKALNLRLDPDGPTEYQRHLLSTYERDIPATNIFLPLYQTCKYLLENNPDNLERLNKSVKLLPISTLGESIGAYINRSRMRQRMLTLDSFEAITTFLTDKNISYLSTQDIEELKRLTELREKWERLDFETTRQQKVDATWLNRQPPTEPLPMFVQQVQTIHEKLLELSEKLRNYRRTVLTYIQVNKTLNNLPPLDADFFDNIDQALQEVGIRHRKLKSWGLLQKTFTAVLEFHAKSPASEIRPKLKSIIKEAKGIGSPTRSVYEAALRLYPSNWQDWMRRYMGVWLIGGGLIGIALLGIVPFVILPAIFVHPTATPTATQTPTPLPTNTFTPTATQTQTPLPLTPTATILHDTNCGNLLTSQLSVGTQARVIATIGVAVVDTPDSIKVTHGLVRNTVVSVLQGPVCHPLNYVRWQVQWTDDKDNVLKGWVTEGESNTYYLEPLPPTTSTLTSNP